MYGRPSSSPRSITTATFECGELGDGARLAAEALDVLRVGRVLLVEHLDRDLAAENPVARAVDARHAAPADELLELVPILQDAPDHRPAG